MSEASAGFLRLGQERERVPELWVRCAMTEQRFADGARDGIQCIGEVEVIDANGGEVVCDTKVSRTLSR
jgi:hypothetical protein